MDNLFSKFNRKMRAELAVEAFAESDMSACRIGKMGYKTSQIARQVMLNYIKESRWQNMIEVTARKDEVLIYKI